MSTNVYEVLRRPLITEKSNFQSTIRQYAFEVRREATKQQIKEAIETLFDVDVVKVNTLVSPAKRGRRLRRVVVRNAAYKKALVTLAEGLNRVGFLKWISEAAANSETERYTFWAPGQATSYFYGYLRWMQMKAETEMALGPLFNRQRYHDFLLAQGLLPPNVIAAAVKTQFIPAERAR